MSYILKRLGGIIPVIITISTMLIPQNAWANADLCITTQNNFSACNTADYSSHGYENHYQDDVYNPGVGYWRAYNGHNCTNYVGYMLTQNGDAGPGVSLGYATQWDNAIQANPGWGYTMNNTPAVGSIAQWEGNDNDPFKDPGHVAYVESVSSDTITISEDNIVINGNSVFRWRTITTTGDWPDKFLHIKDLDSAHLTQLYNSGSGWGEADIANGHKTKGTPFALWGKHNT